MLLDHKGALWHIPVSAVIGFAILLLLLRLSGKRTVAQFNMYDMILTFTVGSVLSSFIVLESVEFADGAAALASIIAVDYAISFAVLKSDRVRRMVKSQPALLVFDGEMQHGTMRSERIVEDEVLMFMRQRGIDRLGDVRAMVLESTGQVSVFTASASDENLSKTLRKSGVDIPD